MSSNNGISTQSLSKVEKQQALRDSSMLWFEPGLPCAAMRNCTNIANAAIATWSGEHWILKPQCDACTLKMARLYGIVPPEMIKAEE